MSMVVCSLEIYSFTAYAKTFGQNFTMSFTQVVLLITMLVYEKWMVTKNIKSMVRNIEVTLPTDSFDNTDEEEVDLKAYYAERPLPDPPYYSNVQAPIYDTVEGVEGIDDVRLPKQSSKVKKSHSRRSQRDK